MTSRSGRAPTVVPLLLCVALSSCLALIALQVRVPHADVVLPGLLAAAFAAAGAVGVRARPDHPGVVLLLATGAAHLSGYALAGWAGAVSHPAGWGRWVAALVGDGLYLAGFVTLALLLAGYPSGAAHRGLAWGAGGFAAVSLTVETLSHERLGLVLDSAVSSVPVPAPLPLATGGPSLVGLVPLWVVGGLVVLWRRARRLDGDELRAMAWARLAATVLVLMLVASPAAYAVLPAHWWDVTFVAVVSEVPFLLLAGLVRYRLLEVEVYAVRTVARAVVAVLVLALYAVGAALLDAGRPAPAVVVLTVLAAWTGRPLVGWLEARTDRWLSAGRVTRRALLARLDETLAGAGGDRLADRACAVIGEALDAGWVRLVSDGRTIAGSLPEGRTETAAMTVPLVAAGHDAGVLECGRRRGGWGAADIALLERLSGRLALLLREQQLSSELAARVAEVEESRSRLVHAEDTARRRIERDLHDGVQQQLVALLLQLRVTQGLLPAGSAAVPALEAAKATAQQSLQDLRQLAAGIHPPLLGDLGLAAAVEARVAPLPIAATLDVDPRVAAHRFPPEVEGAAYFVISEALANVLKHSGSDRVRIVLAALPDDGLRVAVADEGTGEASYAGTGLTGLRDRVEALGGRFTLTAAPGVGTTLVAEFGQRARADA